MHETVKKKALPMKAAPSPHARRFTEAKAGGKSPYLPCLGIANGLPLKLFPRHCIDYCSSTGSSSAASSTKAPLPRTPYNRTEAELPFKATSARPHDNVTVSNSHPAGAVPAFSKPPPIGEITKLTGPVKSVLNPVPFPSLATPVPLPSLATPVPFPSLFAYPVPLPSLATPVPLPSLSKPGLERQNWATPVPLPSLAIPVPLPSLATPVPLPSLAIPVPLPSLATPVPFPSLATPVPLPALATPVPLPSLFVKPVPLPSLATPVPLPSESSRMPSSIAFRDTIEYPALRLALPLNSRDPSVIEIVSCSPLLLAIPLKSEARTGEDKPNASNVEAMTRPNRIPVPFFSMQAL